MDALREPINPAVRERIGDVRDEQPMIHMRIQEGPSGREWD